MNAVALMSFSPGAWAQNVNIQERIDYYDISARTPEQLLEGMEKNAPMIAYSGVQHFAVAESYFNSTYSYSKVNGQCEIDSYDVSVDMVYSMPRWIDQERGGKRVSEYWDQFILNVWTHERGHGDISLATGIELAKAIGKIEPAGDCDAVKEKVDEVSAGVMDERKDVQKDYDKRSRHGLLQGAYFDTAAARRGVKKK